MNKKIPIVIIIVVLLVTSLFFSIKTYLYYREAYINIPIASHQIGQRTKISNEDLQYVSVPKDYVNEDVLTNDNEILDKYVKLSFSIPKGSMIYRSALEDDIKDLANTLLKDGEVNYDIYTNSVKVNTANISKNMYLDLYLTVNNKDKPISDLLLSNARVTGLYDSNNKQIMDYDNDTRVNIISIAINSEYVKVLNKAQVIGELNCIATNNAYDYNLSSMLNKKSALFEYLD